MHADCGAILTAEGDKVFFIDRGNVSGSTSLPFQRSRRLCRVGVCVCVFSLCVRLLGIPGELGVAVGLSMYDWESRDDELGLLGLVVFWTTLNWCFWEQKPLALGLQRFR